MAAVTTGSDFREWYIDAQAHTPQELLTYFQSIKFNPDDVRCMTVLLSDRIISINGYPIKVDAYVGGSAAYNALVSPYTEFDGTPVHAYSYYSDKQKVGIEFAHHPMEVKRPNKTVNVEDFGDFFNSIFDLFISDVVPQLEDKIANMDDLPEGLETGVYYSK